MYAGMFTILQLCIQGNYICERDLSPPKVVYQQPNPKESCYKDGIFYPRCKDLENPEVLYYHNLLRTEK